MAEERVLVTQQIDDETMLGQLWGVYANSFADTVDFCAQLQLCYDEQTLIEAMKDKDYWKFILLVDNVPAGFCLLTNNIRKARIAYIDDRYYCKKFPNYTAQGRVYYVTAICVLPEMQKKGFGLRMLESVIAFIDENESMVAYDYSEAKNGTLTRLIQYVGSTMGMHLVENQLDMQVYTTLHGTHHGDPS
jgi:GNAT superfamily N-acetyltransferase